MADGRHFENRKIAISQWKIVWFWWNSAHYSNSNWWTRLQSRDQKLKFLIFNMAVAAILKIAFLAITHQPIVRFERHFVWRSRTAEQGLHDKNSKFLKSKMAVAAILKLAFLAITHQPILRFQLNFVWRSRMACRQGLHDKNCKFLKSKMADGRHFDNR